MEQLISVIIPCYNAENTIARCLDSVFSNTYKNIEVICINDGSKDNTLDILLIYKKGHSNLIVINQENKRQGYCRNRGIEKASGEYIIFIDSDDTIEPFALEEFLKLVQGYDVAICNFNYVSGNTVVPNGSKVNGELSLRQFWEEDINDPTWAVVPWNKIYKKEVLHDIRFKENVYFEDEFFTNDLFSKDIRINFTNKCLYNYFDNASGTMRTNSVYRKLYRGEARIIRSRFLLEQKWNPIFAITVREALYLVLWIKDISKREKTYTEYSNRIKKCLQELRDIIKKSIAVKLKTPWDVSLYGRSKIMFGFIYFFRRIVRIILRREKINAP